MPELPQELPHRAQTLLTSPLSPGPRAIQGLRLVELSPTGPGWGRRRLKGARAQGMTHERAVGRELGRLAPELEPHLGSGLELVSGQWLFYRDANGNGYAQPDHYLVGSRGVLLVECKLTQTPRAEHQLRHLYGPLLAALYDRPVWLLEAARRVRDLSLVVLSPAERFERPEPIVCWHYLG